MKITKSDFNKYEKVRRSGVTNMFDIRRVEELSGLSREQIKTIMLDYKKLFNAYCTYPVIRGDGKVVKVSVPENLCLTLKTITLNISL